MRKYCIIFLIGLSGCAQKTGLTGGPIDQKAPVIQQSIPTSFSTNYNNDFVEFYYNEEVLFKNQQAEVVISPPLKTKPEFLTQGKKVQIKWSDTLLQNTTYTIQLGQSIVDATEGNPIDSAQFFVFSTGPTIDSLEITGTVLDAFTYKPIPTCWVLLHPIECDTCFQKNRPLFIAKTDTGGVYTLSNLPTGAYQLFALQDINSNLRYDLPTEKIALLESNVLLQDSSQKANLLMFDEKESGKMVQVLKKDIYKPSFVELVFSEDIQSFAWKNENVLFSTKSLPNDTLGFWLEDSSLFNQKSTLYFTYNDTLQDSLRISGGELKKKPQELKVDKIKKWNKDLVLTSIYPMIHIDSSKINLYRDSTPQNIQIYFDSLNPYTFSIKNEWKQDTTYQLVLLPNAVRALYDSTQKDTLRFDFQTDAEDQYAQLTIRFEDLDSTKSYFFQLLTENQKIVDEEYVQDQKIILSDVKISKYQARVFMDDNKNKTWDVGTLKSRALSEKIWNYNGLIEWNEGFDLEINWSLK